MSLLSQITTGRKGRAQKVCIYGPEGFGKSSIAGKFPRPLFFDVEDSTSQMDVARLGREALPTLKVLESALGEVVATKPCATLIVDTVDWLEQMALEAIIESAKSDKINSIEDFGYGKGYVKLAERMTVILARLDEVIAAGISVVLLAHSKVSKFDPPDGAAAFDRYELKLTKHVAPLVKEWCDMLIFGNYKLVVREPDGGKAKGMGGKERLMHCARTAAWDAKNRHGLAEIEKWEIGVFERAFTSVSAPWNLEAGTAAPATTGAGVPASDAASAQSQPATQTAATTSTTAPVTPPPADDIPMQHPTDPQSKEDQDITRICQPHDGALTAYLRSSKKIGPEQTWRDMPADYRRRVLGNPAGFLKVALAGNGGVK